MNFIEERLNLGIDYGTLATITTSTGIVEDGGGGEQRTINWEQPLLRFNLSQRSYTNAINNELAYILDFYQRGKGAFGGFRFRDWADWYARGQSIGTGDGIKTGFQLHKSYTVADWTVRRPITKPVAGTVKIYVNGVEVSGWTINTATGLVTFTTAPTGAITADFEFDVPVRFESDEIRLRFMAYEPGTGRKIFEWEGMSLIEVRVPVGAEVPIDPVPALLDHTIKLGYDYGTIGGNRFSTRIDRLVSGHDRKIANWETPRGDWEIGQRTLNLEELEYLIALFRVCRGRAVGFRYLDRAENAVRSVRFGEDAIAFRFDAYERGTGKVIFDLSGVPISALKLPETCSPTMITFVEDFFNLARWRQEILLPLNNGPVYDASLTVSPAGGNPGSHAIIRLDWGGSSGAGVTSTWIALDWIYVPRFANERITVTLAQDTKLIETTASGGAGQAYGLVIKQENNYYYSYATTQTPSGWTRQSLIVDLAVLGIPLTPEIPLEFGFYRANSNAGESSINYSIFGLDNLSTTISVTCG